LQGGRSRKKKDISEKDKAIQTALHQGRQCGSHIEASGRFSLAIKAVTKKSWGPLHLILERK
jgi:hypothetical protein